MIYMMTYTDVDGKPPAFTIQPPKPDAQVIREGVFPGMFGFADVHFTHLYFRFAGTDDEIMVIATTNVALDERRPASDRRAGREVFDSAAPDQPR